MDAHGMAAALGVVAGLVGAYVHRRGQVRSWAPHLMMGAAMGAMALPRHDPLGPAGWMLLLGGAAAWALGRPRPDHPLARARAAVALDLYVMGVLTLLMPTLHNGSAAHATSSAGSAAGLGAAGGGHGGPSGWWLGAYVAVLAVWILARFALATAEHRRRQPVTAPAPPRRPGQSNVSMTSACSAAMITSMTLMAFAP